MELQTRILSLVDQYGRIDDIAAALQESGLKVDTVALQAAVTSLAGHNRITCETIDTEYYVLTDEGNQIVFKGSHEARVFEAIASNVAGLTLDELVARLDKDTAKIGQGRAFKQKWIKKGEQGRFVSAVDKIEDTTRLALISLAKNGKLADQAQLQELVKRNIVERKKKVSYKTAKGTDFDKRLQRLETELTMDMLTDGSWESAQFKPYNYEALGTSPAHGTLHPLLKVRAEFRQIFFEMGFTEMPANNFVETSFWNFDALFVPQQHPARDLQDTFYIKDPAKSILPSPTDANYAKCVKQVHQEGLFGSIGYRYPYSMEESQRLVLRTHTTSVSAAELYDLCSKSRAAGKPCPPARLFSIDRVFRNETVDATHLAEFHQVEGVIADYNLTLGDLIGFMQTFFGKMGVSQLRFKPAYNPYTEPSLEIFSYHVGLGKWVEIGNSGMFRPEMLESIGLPRKMRVHGFGLSLERPTMIRYQINNIRDLVGHKVDIAKIQKTAAVRLDKQSRAESKTN